MSKYKDIMDNIELTDEMRERVLKNVKGAAKSSVAPTPIKKANRTVIMQIIGYAAACLLIATVIFFAWKSTQKGKVTPSSIVPTDTIAPTDTVAPTDTEITTPSDSGVMAGGSDGSDPSQTGNVRYPLHFDDISGINQEYGLKLSDLTTLPFTPAKTICTGYSFGAEIIYFGKDLEECCWHICRESKPIDDIAENFPIHKTVETADGTTITLYNGETDYFMAKWFDGTNYQSLQFISTVPEETFMTIIEEIKGMQ